MPRMSKKPNVKIAKNAEIAEIARISKTEMVRFLEMFKIWVFLGKIDGRFEKSLSFIQNFSRWQICCRIRINWFHFSKMSTALIMKFFCEKNQKTLNVRKSRNYDEGRVLFREKKNISSFKSLLYKNGKAQNMPVVAGRLVFDNFQYLRKRSISLNVFRVVLDDLFLQILR